MIFLRNRSFPCLERLVIFFSLLTKSMRKLNAQLSHFSYFYKWQQIVDKNVLWLSAKSQILLQAWIGLNKNWLRWQILIYYDWTGLGCLSPSWLSFFKGGRLFDSMMFVIIKFLFGFELNVCLSVFYDTLLIEEIFLWNSRDPCS